MLDIDICFLAGRILTPNHPKAPENGAFPLFAIHNGEGGGAFRPDISEKSGAVLECAFSRPTGAFWLGKHIFSP